MLFQMKESALRSKVSSAWRVWEPFQRHQLTWLTWFAPDEQHVYSFWLRDKLALRGNAMCNETRHAAPDGASHYL